MSKRNEATTHVQQMYFLCFMVRNNVHSSQKSVRVQIMLERNIYVQIYEYGVYYYIYYRLTRVHLTKYRKQTVKSLKGT